MRPVVETEAERKMLEKLFRKRNGYSPSDCVPAPKTSILRVVEMYLKDEQRHYEEYGDAPPKDHIYHDLKKLRRALIEAGCNMPILFKGEKHGKV